MSVRLAWVEARAALAHAGRLGRISPQQHTAARRELEMILGQVDAVEIDADLVDRAAAHAEQHALRAYDAVHLAAATRLFDADLVVVAGDRALLGAAEDLGMATAVIG